jgi:thioredoxin-related protein
MKLFLLTMVAVTTIAITSYAQNLTPIALGSTAPKSEVKMKDISGKDISLKDAVGNNGLLVMFSCNTCPYVVKNEARTKAISDYASKNGYGVIIINSNEALRGDEDSYDAMKAYAKSQGYKWHYVVDNNSEIANAFGATRTPETFLFNKEGKLIYHGAIDDNPSDASNVKREHLKEAINEANAGKDISVKESRSVGCTIKRVM